MSRARAGLAWAVFFASAVTSVACHRSDPPPPVAETSAAATSPGSAPSAGEWQLLASELPSALLSVSGRSPVDIYAVGADKGKGPLVLHFDGTKWTSVPTGQHGDLWWVQTFASGAMIMGGAGGMVLRGDGQHFARLAPPSLPKTLPTKGTAAKPGDAGADSSALTVYGVWGKNSDDFYAVGNSGGTHGFVWHFHGGTFDQVVLPKDLPRTSTGDAPGFFKAWGNGDDVWVVGTAGALLHKKGDAPFVSVASGTKDTLFTISGSPAGDRVVAVGGSGNGVLLDGTSGAFHDSSPTGAGLLQGISVSLGGANAGDWTSGERGAIYHRPIGAPAFVSVDHGLTLPSASSLHAIFVDPSGGVWSVGGNVLTTALDNGMLLHMGAANVPTVAYDD